MKNEIQEFENDELGVRVRCIQNEDGSISMNAEDTAIGFGVVQIKNEKVYARILRNYCCRMEV